MPEPDDLSSLERVRRRLYDANAPLSVEAPRLSVQPVSKAKGWEHIKEQQVVKTEREHMSAPARFFIAALVFFVLALGGAGLYLVYGGRAVSTNNVVIGVQSQATIASGDTIPLLITVDNKNPVPLHSATVTITFPDGTKSPDDPNTALTSYTENLGDIPAGGHIEKTVKATVFGSEGQHVTLPITIEYHTDSSNSAFVKDKQYEFIVTTSPISLTVQALTQISSGQPLTVDVLVRSNATTPLENVAVSATYPFVGFAPGTLDPKPASGTLFVLGTFQPGEEKHIRITGVVSGEEADDRIFKFSAGVLSAPDAPTIATTYTNKEIDIKLTKPFLSTTLSVNHDSSASPVIQGGTQIQSIVTWMNSLAVPVTNAQVTVALSGDALDLASILGGNGFYRSSDATILYTPQTNPGLAQLNPGDSGQGNFSFATKQGSALAALRGPSVTVKISVAGQRLSETNVPEMVTSTVTRVIKIGTNLGLASRVVRTIGPLANTGPWPPVIDKETTYTVQYALTNTVNAVAGAKVTATLPLSVRFTGKSSPSDGSLTYDDVSRTVTWIAGDIPAGTVTPKTMSFQVALTPSVSQQGDSPLLVNEQQVTGHDRFTDRDIQGTVNALTTKTTSDPAYTGTQGNVK